MYNFKIVGITPMEIFRTIHDKLDSKGNQYCHCGDLEIEWNEGSYSVVEKDIRNCSQVILIGNDEGNSLIFDCGNFTYWMCHIVPASRPGLTMKGRVDWMCFMEAQTSYSASILLNKNVFSTLISCFYHNISFDGREWVYMLEDYII